MSVITRLSDVSDDLIDDVYDDSQALWYWERTECRRDVPSNPFAFFLTRDFSLEKRLNSLLAVLEDVDAKLSRASPSPLEVPSSIYAGTVDEVDNAELSIEDEEESRGRGPPAGEAEKPQPHALEREVSGRPVSALVWTFKPDRDDPIEAYGYPTRTIGYTVSVSRRLQLAPKKLDDITSEVKPQVACVQELAPSLRYPSTAAKFLASYLHCLPKELSGTGGCHTYGYVTLSVTKSCDLEICPAWVPSQTPHPSEGTVSASAKRLRAAVGEDEVKPRKGHLGSCGKRQRTEHPVRPNALPSSPESTRLSVSIPGRSQRSSKRSSSISQNSGGRINTTYRPRRRKDNDDEEGDDGPRPPKGKVPASDTGQPQRQFACPFFKNNAGKYRSWRSCCGPGWPNVHRLKEHLPEKAAHESSEPKCTPRDDVVEGMTPDQEQRVRLRMCVTRFPSELDKWREVYGILFPSDDLSFIPSPYYDDHVPSSNTPGGRVGSLLELLRDDHSTPGAAARERLSYIVQHRTDLPEQTREGLVESMLQEFCEIFAQFYDAPGRDSRLPQPPLGIIPPPRPQPRPLPGSAFVAPPMMDLSFDPGSVIDIPPMLMPAPPHQLDTSYDHLANVPSQHAGPGFDTRSDVQYPDSNYLSNPFPGSTLPPGAAYAPAALPFNTEIPGLLEWDESGIQMDVSQENVTQWRPYLYPASSHPL
ncbi:hypothetical protein GQ53DRAFT_828722 [Thozetella sp. PMI_491]|nr:hypothetical protein GQ53DRAFT_828722 [Thozetella sp. PMI_491]